VLEKVYKSRDEYGTISIRPVWIEKGQFIARFSMTPQTVMIYSARMIHHNTNTTHEFIKEKEVLGEVN